MAYFKHGLTNLPTYHAWHNMRLRGRVPAWDAFETFLVDMGEMPPEGARLQRYDAAQPYSPDNAYWAMKAAKQHPFYSVWKSMTARCRDPNVESFKDYGARGITVCPEWRRSFSAFARDMGERPEGYTIERLNNDLGYSPENCVWATRSEQMKNRRPFTRRTKAEMAEAFA